MLAPALLVEWITQRRLERSGSAPVVGILAVFAGPIAYIGYWAARGDPLQPLQAQDSWNRELALPLTTIGQGISLGLEGLASADGWYWTIDLVLAVAVLTLVIVGWRILAASYLTFTVGSLLVPLMYPWPGRPLLAMGRFAIVLFPIFWIGARLVRTKVGFVAVVIISALGWTGLAVLFMNWRYVL
jgi:hypothetical protein